MSVGSFMLTMSVGCFMWFLPPPAECQHHRPGWLTATRISTATSVLCVFLCRGWKLKAPQRHIDNTVIDSYFHSDILFLAVYLLCGGVLFFGWYFDYPKNETTTKAVYLLCLVCSCTLPRPERRRDTARPRRGRRCYALSQSALIVCSKSIFLTW